MTSKASNGRRERYKQQTEAERIAKQQQFTWLEAVELYNERVESKRLNKQRRMAERRRTNQQRRNGAH